MSRRYWRKLALLAKIESVYGTDPTPTGADNAIQAVDAQFTPMEGGEEQRELLVPWLGHQGVILTGLHGRLEFSVEVAGAGAAGDAPPYGALLRACGLSETVTGGVDVEYAPVSTGFEAVSIYYNRDGVRHILLGARGTVSMQFPPNRIPRFRFNLIGLHGTVSDQALPAVTLSGFQKPVVVSKANTQFSLHAYAGPTENISIDLGNQVEPRLLVNYEAAEIVDRRATGQVVMEATNLATKNWDAIVKAHTDGALALTHGTVAGNIVAIAAPAVQIGRYGEGQSQNILNNTLPLMIKPQSGNDELTITVS
ncbi:hypothetical protein FQ775_01010 [Nitratireductor mangrovi]|uniref:Phage tail protein n=1 Tax=Nitratireductor mangrovi TaxID=2599600 RepID=A0A5B8KU00_9HYPH|nr:phage tail tube protein [Nitratireductor mangrovi]QDY99061.1 hypothetical protein FQ775_01010 [Nitratireductor mangrovi]